MYASIEVGGLLRSLDGGATWRNIIDGIYIDEGFVDIHSVVVNPDREGQLTIATRFGAFRSDDRGVHWRNLEAPLMRPVGSYCRVLRYAPNDGNALYLAAANDFDGDRGALFISEDNGGSWLKAEPGVSLKTPIFGLAVDPNNPDNVFYSSKIGQLVYSRDRGKSWAVNPLPAGAGTFFRWRWDSVRDLCRDWSRPRLGSSAHGNNCGIVRSAVSQFRRPQSLCMRRVRRLGRRRPD